MPTQNDNEHWNKQLFLERMMQNHQLALTVLSVFVEDIPKQMEIIKNSVLNNEIENLISASHNLKGAASNVTADKLAILAEQLEFSAPCDHKEMTNMVIKLENELDLILTRFQTELDSKLS